MRRNFTSYVSRRLLFSCLFLILSLRVQTVSAQDDTIRVNTDLINIPVTVLDRDGRYISKLKAGDFRIFEDGREQEITLFSTTEVPITVMLLFDVSSSITNRQTADMIKAANILVQQLRPNDWLMAATYSYHTYPLVKLTKVRDLKSSIKIELHPFDAYTLIYDAVAYSQKRMSKVKGRKALIIFGDGVDSGLAASFKSTVKTAEEEETLIYTAQIQDYPNPPYTDPEKFAKSVKTATDYMEALARKTGGRHFMIDDVVNLGAMFGDIGDELRQQYTLGYYSNQPGKDGERRKITVKVNVPNVAVRSRNEVVYRKSNR